MFSHICARWRILARRAYMIGMDKPSESTMWRMVAILAYSLEIPFTHDEALNHKSTIRQCINDLNRSRPRGIDVPRIIHYADSIVELDGVTAMYAYGTSLPEPVSIHTAAARRLGSAREGGAMGRCSWLGGRCSRRPTASYARSLMLSNPKARVQPAQRACGSLNWTRFCRTAAEWSSAPARRSRTWIS